MLATFIKIFFKAYEERGHQEAQNILRLHVEGYICE